MLARLRALVQAARPLQPRRLAAVAALVLAGAVTVVLVDMLEGVAARDVASAVRGTGGLALAGAILASAGSYAALVGFERLAIREAGVSVAPRLVALTGFISWAFTFVLGFGVVTGGAVRLRRYGRTGLAAVETLRVTLLGAVFFWVGIAAVAGLSLLAAPQVLRPLLGLPDAAAFALGLAVTLGLGVSIARGGRALRLGKQALALPGRRTGLWVVALGIADTGLAALGLWCVLPPGTPMPFLAFLPVFAMATVAGVVSHAPGGVGAFEAVILISVPGDTPALLAALLVFRLVYYVAPFSLAAIAFAAAEVAPQRRRLGALPPLVLSALRPLAPSILSAAVFAAGLVLLLTGALPGEAWRMSGVTSVLPLPLVEVAHLGSALAGAALLIVGSGLRKRVRAAWTATLALLAAEAVLAMARGLDYEEATLCLALIVILAFARDKFDRGGGVLQAVSLRRIAAIGGAIGLSFAVGLAAGGGGGAPAAGAWHLAAGAEVPRFLRASLGALLVLALLLAWRAARRPVRVAAGAPAADGLERLVAAAQEPGANLAFLGDKRFLFDDGRGFIMYQVRRGTWLAMGDPLAQDRAAAAALIWRFRELAHRGGGECAFYQVSEGMLPLYIEAGFSFVKLGEDAVVDLTRFSMEGARAARFRQSVARARRAGCTFELVPPAAVAALLPALKPVSDAWLARQKGREKGFSIGFWDEAYLSRFEVALVRCGDRPVAFATLWPGADGQDLAIDLMRYGDDLPGDTMDFLFLSLMEAARARGIARLGLGMAPLSGLVEHRLAPAWSRVGATVYRCGGAFYNFSGLRAYKEKFHPEWRPRYLAHAGGRSLARVLLDATLIIARGPEGRIDPAPAPDLARGPLPHADADGARPGAPDASGFDHGEPRAAA